MIKRCREYLNAKFAVQISESWRLVPVK